MASFFLFLLEGRTYEDKERVAFVSSVIELEVLRFPGL